MHDFNRSIQLDPESARAYIWRGDTWHNQGDLDKALSDYNEAIRLDPKDAGAYNNRGGAWYDKGEFGNAIVDFNESIRLDPEYGSCLLQPRHDLARKR